MGGYSKRLHARIDGERLEGVSLTVDLTLSITKGRANVAYQLPPAEALALGEQLISLARNRGATPHRALVAAPEGMPAGIESLESDAYAVILSSERPIPFSDRVRILDHSPGAVQLARRELPLMWEHDARQLIGIVRALRLVGGQLHGIAYFASTDFAQDIRRKVDAGELSDVSVAFSEIASVPIEAGIRLTQWTPLELSVCKKGGNPDAKIMPLAKRYE